MKNTMFFMKDGNVSSIIHRLLPNTFTTSYPSDHTRGGSTVINKYAISRYDKSGRLMSFGIVGGKGRNIQYFDKNYRPISKITPF
jgi:hypothetical protein